MNDANELRSGSRVMTRNQMDDRAALFDFTLALGDDALVLGHRLSEWSGSGPTLEQDIALSNLGLDLIGQARLLYTYAGEVEGEGRSEDDLAYFRGQGEFRNLLITELPIGDFAFTIARHFLYAAFIEPYFSALTRSADEQLSAIAAKAHKEMLYHVRHTSEWMIRLGDGTDESRRRLATALDDIWGYTGEMFEMDGAEQGLVAAGIAPDRSALKLRWEETVARVLEEATLAMPKPRNMQTGGRRGLHTEHLGRMLDDMQSLARAHPGAVW